MAYAGRFGALARSIGVASEKAKPKNTKRHIIPKNMNLCNIVIVYLEKRPTLE